MMQEQKAKSESPKQWMWSPEEQFQVDGKSVEILINLVQSILQDSSSAKVMWAIEADKVLSQLMNKGIQDGQIKDKAEFEKTDLERWLESKGIEKKEELQKIEVSSLDFEMMKILNPQNHLSSRMDISLPVLSEIFGWEITKIPNKISNEDAFAVEHTIEKWTDENMEIDEKGNILIFVKNSAIRWIPKIEFEFLSKFKGSSHLTWGYIDGRASHLGVYADTGHVAANSFHGYRMWVEGDKNSEIYKSKNWPESSEPVEKLENTDTNVTGILPDSEHYRNMSDEELQVSLGVNRNRYKEKPKIGNMFRYNIAHSSPKFILDGKYWIPEAEYEILKEFKGQRINFSYSNDTPEGYTFHVSKY